MNTLTARVLRWLAIGMSFQACVGHVLLVTGKCFERLYKTAPAATFGPKHITSEGCFGRGVDKALGRMRAVVFGATVVLASYFVTTSVKGDVIDFDSIPEVPGVGISNLEQPYVEDGFALTSNNGSFLILHPGFIDGDGTIQYIGSATVFSNTRDSEIILSKLGGGSFAINAIDLAELNGNNIADVTFVGLLSGGGFVTQTFTLDGVGYAAQTFTFNSMFANLLSVSWHQEFPYHMFDNIVVDGVAPSPICVVSPNNDFCLVSASTNIANVETDAEGGIDTLQLGGDANFAFEVSKIGPTQVFRNFETFQKIGLSNVSLIGTATTVVDWDIRAGTLTASGGNAIGDTSNVNAGSAATFALTNSEAIGSLSGNGILNLGGNTLTVGGGGNSVWAGSSVGSGGITKIGSSTFTIDSSQGFLGLTDVAAGELRLNGSLAGALTIEQGASLSGSGSVAGTITNNGNIAPGNSPGIQSYLGNYVAGAGATLTMEVQLDNGGAPQNGTTHDFVSIAGNATGVTTINLVASGAPVSTGGNGFELVRVGGSVSPTAFSLSAPLLSGAFQYALNYLQDYSGTQDGYFLKASIRDEIYGQAAILASGQALTQACLRSDDRMPGIGSDQGKSRGWAKFTDGSLKVGAGTGIDAEQDYSCGTGGVDVAIGDGLRVGAVGGYGSSKTDVAVPSGIANLMGDSGSIEGVASYYSEHSFASLSAGYSQTDWSFRGPVVASGSATSSGLVGALQAGMVWPVGNNLSIKLIGEADYDGTQCESDCLLPGTTETVSKWLAKGTVRLDGSLSGGMLLPYVAVSYADDLDDGNSVAMGGAAISTRTTSNLLGVSGGVTALIDANTALFANVKYTGSLDKDVVGLDGSVGAKVYW